MDPQQVLSGMLAGSILMMLVSLAFSAAWFGLFLAALIHCLKHKHDKDRLTWIIVVIFVPLIGAILYFTIGKDQDTGHARATLPPVGGPPPAIIPHAMEDEKARAAAINASLSASSARQRGK